MPTFIILAMTVHASARAVHGLIVGIIYYRQDTAGEEWTQLRITPRAAAANSDLDTSDWTSEKAEPLLKHSKIHLNNASYDMMQC